MLEAPSYSRLFSHGRGEDAECVRMCARVCVRPLRDLPGYVGMCIMMSVQ